MSSTSPEYPRYSETFNNAPLIGLTDYGAAMEALASVYDAVTPDHGAQAFARALLAVCERFSHDTRTVETHLIEYLNHRDDTLRICRVVTFQAGV